MLITLLREQFTPNETLGRLLIDNQPVCHTLEPPIIPNALHPKGCIPAGWYRLSVTHSPKFCRKLPLLHCVPGFTGIRLHAGNHRAHTAGCILVGIASGGWQSLSESAMPMLHKARVTEQKIVELLLKAETNHEENYIKVCSIN